MSKPLPNNIPKCPKGLDAILYLLVVFLQPTAFIMAFISVGSIRVGPRTIADCLFGIGTALYILIAKALSRPVGYNYYAVLVLSAVNFLADQGIAGYCLGMGLYSYSWSALTLGGLYTTQAILWLVYLIIVAVAVYKHRKAGGHSKWKPDEQNPRHDDSIPDPLSSTVLPYRREPPPDSHLPNIYQLGSVRINQTNTNDPPRLDSFGGPAEERCAVGGELSIATERHRQMSLQSVKKREFVQLEVNEQGPLLRDKAKRSRLSLLRKELNAANRGEELVRMRGLIT